MNTMTVTVDQDNGVQAYFKIEFKNQDFMAVVDSIDNLNMVNVFNNPLWKVI